MPIRLVGRESHFRGKTLYQIASNLKNNGVGRVVARYKFADRYEEQSYYRLTKVIPDLSDKETRRGDAWGIKVFRGENFGERKINAGMKLDWRLIPKEEEAEFCQELAQPRAGNVVPKFMPCPPLLELLVKKDMRARGEDTSKPLNIPKKINKSFLNKATQKDAE